MQGSLPIRNPVLQYLSRYCGQLSTRSRWKTHGTKDLSPATSLYQSALTLQLADRSQLDELLRHAVDFTSASSRELTRAFVVAAKGRREWKAGGVLDRIAAKLMQCCDVSPPGALADMLLTVTHINNPSPIFVQTMTNALLRRREEINSDEASMVMKALSRLPSTSTGTLWNTCVKQIFSGFQQRATTDAAATSAIAAMARMRWIPDDQQMTTIANWLFDSMGRLDSHGQLGALLSFSKIDNGRNQAIREKLLEEVKNRIHRLRPDELGHVFPTMFFANKVDEEFALDAQPYLMLYAKEMSLIPLTSVLRGANSLNQNLPEALLMVLFQRAKQLLAESDNLAAIATTIFWMGRVSTTSAKLRSFVRDAVADFHSKHYAKATANSYQLLFGGLAHAHRDVAHEVDPILLQGLVARVQSARKLELRDAVSIITYCSWLEIDYADVRSLALRVGQDLQKDFRQTVSPWSLVRLVGALLTWGCPDGAAIGVPLLRALERRQKPLPDSHVSLITRFRCAVTDTSSKTFR